MTPSWILTRRATAWPPRARTLEAGDSAGAAARAQRAADLSALPFLPQHDGEWVDRIRDELHTTTTAALELLARAHASAGNRRAAVAAAERLMRAEPYSEAAHRLLMGVLVDTGDRPGAIDAYDECRAMLERELGVIPSDETEAVLARALAPAAVTADAPSSRRPRQRRPPATNPARRTCRPRRRGPRLSTAHSGESCCAGWASAGSARRRTATPRSSCWRPRRRRT